MVHIILAPSRRKLNLHWPIRCLFSKIRMTRNALKISCEVVSTKIFFSGSTQIPIGWSLSDNVLVAHCPSLGVIIAMRLFFHSAVPDETFAAWLLTSEAFLLMLWDTSGRSVNLVVLEGAAPALIEPPVGALVGLLPDPRRTGVKTRQTILPPVCRWRNIKSLSVHERTTPPTCRTIRTLALSSPRWALDLDLPVDSGIYLFVFFLQIAHLGIQSGEFFVKIFTAKAMYPPPRFICTRNEAPRNPPQRNLSFLCLNEICMSCVIWKVAFGEWRNLNKY